MVTRVTVLTVLRVTVLTALRVFLPLSLDAVEQGIVLTCICHKAYKIYRATFCREYNSESIGQKWVFYVSLKERKHCGSRNWFRYHFTATIRIHKQ
jgi:hypothetical protein